MIAAGIGCRKGVSAAEVMAAVDAAAARDGVGRADLSLIAAPAFKGGETGIAEAAARFGLPLVLVPEDRLRDAADKATTRSEKVVALTGLNAVAESAALAALGDGAALLGPRVAVGPVTCALARAEP